MTILSLKALFIFVASLSLAACAPNKHWANPNKTNQGFHHDKSECLVMAMNATNNLQPSYQTPTNSGSGRANAVVGGLNAGTAMATQRERQRIQQQIYTSCMMGRGWTLGEKTNVSPSYDQITDVNIYDRDIQGVHVGRIVTISKGPVGLYSEPSSQSERLQVLSTGNKLTVVSSENEWLQVETTSGETGWIHRDWIKS